MAAFEREWRRECAVRRRRSEACGDLWKLRARRLGAVGGLEPRPARGHHSHVVGVEHAVCEADALPDRDEPRRPPDHLAERRQPEGPARSFIGRASHVRPNARGRRGRRQQQRRHVVEQRGQQRGLPDARPWVGADGEVRAAPSFGRGVVAHATVGGQSMGGAPALPVTASAGLQTSKEPKRRKEGARRSTTLARSCRTFPSYLRSRATSVSEVTTERARVVGTPSAAFASEPRNSRSDERSTLRPSAERE